MPMTLAVATGRGPIFSGKRLRLVMWLALLLPQSFVIAATSPTVVQMGQDREVGMAGSALPSIGHGTTDTRSPAPSSSAREVGLPANIPLKRDPPELSNSASYAPVLVGALTIFVALFYAGWRIWAMRAKNSPGGNSFAKWIRAKSSHELRVIESTRLTPRHTVHALEWRGTVFLIACSEQSVTVLNNAGVSGADAIPGAPGP